MGFFQAVTVLVLLYGCTVWTLIRCTKKNPGRNTHKRVAVWPLISHRSKTNKTWGVLLKKQRRTHKQYFLMDSLHIDTPVVVDQQGFGISSVRTLDVVRSWWLTIGTVGERKSEKSVLSAWLDMCVCVCVCVCVRVVNDYTVFDCKT